MPRVASMQSAWGASIADYVIDLGFSPDGKTLAAASVSGPVSLYDAPSGRAAGTLRGHDPGTVRIAWRPDGRMLGTAGQDGRARLWDSTSLAEVASLDGGGAWVEHLAWHPRGIELATGAGRTLRRFSPTGARLGEERPAPSTIAALGWRPDGGMLAMGRYGGVELIRRDGGATETLEWKGSILSLAWSPDGGALAGGGQDCSVQFWFFKKGERLEMSGYAAKVKELAWGGSFLATSGAPTVIVWDCSGKGPKGRRPIRCEHHEGLVTALAFQPKGDGGVGLLASGSEDGGVALWDVREPKRPLATSMVDGAVARLAWSPDGSRLAIGMSGGEVQVMGVSDGATRRVR